MSREHFFIEHLFKNSPFTLVNAICLLCLVYSLGLRRLARVGEMEFSCWENVKAEFPIDSSLRLCQRMLCNSDSQVVLSPSFVFNLLVAEACTEHYLLPRTAPEGDTSICPGNLVTIATAEIQSPYSFEVGTFLAHCSTYFRFTAT